MHRVTFALSDEDYKTLNKIARMSGYNMTDLIRMFINNYDPDLEVKLLSKNENKDAGDYWFNYSNYDMFGTPIMDDPHHVYGRKPLGQSLLEVLKKDKQDENQKYQTAVQVIGNLKAITFLLSNISNNVNQIAKSLNEINKYHMQDQIDIKQTRKELSKVRAKSRNYVKKVKYYLGLVKNYS